MANIRTLQRSFAGGEVSPEMYGRIDDNKYQSGAATMRNFIAKPQGPAENRPGFAYVNEVKNSTKKTRLIPFTFNTTQTMVIEMSPGYFRFHTMGGTLLSGGVPYEIANPYAEADLFDIHYVQSADVLTLVHPNYPPKELKRLGATNWTLTDVSFAPSVSSPTGVTATSTGFTTGKYNYYYKVTAIASDEVSESAPSGEALGAAKAISAITKANPGVITTATHGLSVGDKVYISGIAGMTELNDKYYIVNTVPSTTELTLKTTSGTIVDTTSYGTYTSGGNVYPAFIRSNLLETGCTNTISWNAVAGAVRYNVYKLQGGIYGYIGQTAGTSIIDDNIGPDMGVSPPTYDSVFGSAGNYPGAVSYFEQRRVFAGTTNDPQTIWMTKSGTESNMSYSLPIKDDDRIKFRVAAREANTIRHIVPLTQLLLLTAAAEWRVTSVNSDAITPTTISVRPQSYVGSNNVQPVLVNNTMIYAASRGGHVRELGYSWQANGFVTGDMSIRATHLFDEYNIVDMAYSKAPTPIVWMISSSGKLLGLTYVPEQSIGAWHQHDTDGLFESCTVVAEGNEDVLYAVIKRTINGSSKRYVERMRTRLIDDPAKAFFVDSGASYDGTNTGSTTATITGTGYTPADTLTIFMSASTFTYPGTTNVGDAIVLTDAAGNKYRVTITSVLAVNEALGKVDNELPAELQDTATTNWALAINDVTGLSWLEGKTVNILADGSVHPQRVVTSGAISLDRAATIINVGLPITADLKTLPVAQQIDGGMGQGRMKNVNKAWLRVYQSSGIFVGPDENNLVEAKQRTTEPYGSPPALKSQEILVMTTPSWADSGQVFIRQSDPLPLTLVGLTLEVAIGS